MIGPSDIQIILGKVRPLSRPLTEAHPQVLIIARQRFCMGRSFTDGRGTDTSTDSSATIRRAPV
nr:MAG: hypothetical protein DIU75_22010 [Mycolicibacterium hassiacum]